MTRAPLPDGKILIGNLDKYKIISYAAEGGFGITYKVKRVSDNQIFAMKEAFPNDKNISREKNSDNINIGINYILDNFGATGEAHIHQQVNNHPLIVNFEEKFDQNNTSYIITEWIEGKTLYELKEEEFQLNKEIFDEPLITKVLINMLDVIFFLADENAAHRDMNPSNIMLRNSNLEPVLIDFGTSRFVSGGFTFDPKTPVHHPWVAPPEQLISQGYQREWLDIYSLCATLYFCIANTPFHKVSENGDIIGKGKTLIELKENNEKLLNKYSNNLLITIDSGLRKDIIERPRSGAAFLKKLKLSDKNALGYLYSGSDINIPFFQGTRKIGHKISPSGKPIKEETNLSGKYPNQTVIIQSFDTARFHETSIIKSDGEKLFYSDEEKIALARTETLINILFGREIVVPAGQIAESPAFRIIFSEIMDAYFDKSEKKIESAYNKLQVPVWKPFRLALENKNTKDYTGFTREYKYTGAPMVALAANNKSQKEHMTIGKGIEGLVKIFGIGDFDKLEELIEIKGYGEFAKRVKSYFTEEVSIFSNPDWTAQKVNNFADTFYARLKDEELVGNGVNEAKASLDLVDNIASDLDQELTANLRGNWYIYAEKFGDIWPLARAYLDFRLYLNFTAQYNIDHPILISQEFEYGKFTHDLFLGRRISGGEDEAAEKSYLHELSKNYSEKIQWNEIFELFEKPEFILSIERMNWAYNTNKSFQIKGTIESHGALLNKYLPNMIKFNSANSKFELKDRSSKNAQLLEAYSSYEPSSGEKAYGLNDETQKKRVFEKIENNISTHVSVGILPIGNKMSSTMINYYTKPYGKLVRG